MIDLSMLPDFIVEAAEHLEELESSLLRLEQDGGKESKEVLDEIFRSVHTIKGAAQFVGIDRISELSHKLENLLDLIRKGAQPLSSTVIELLIAAKDRIGLLVEELERSQGEKAEVADLLEKIKNIVEGKAIAAEPEKKAVAVPEEPPQSVPQVELVEEPRKGVLAEESMTEEYDEELYSIFLQQLKENIPFLYAQTVELSLSVDKQDVLYRCSDSIKSLKSSANYMGYEKLARHYSNWQRDISSAVEQLSSGKMPNLAFMQDYIDEIIRSFPQAMEGYSQEEAERSVRGRNDGDSVENALDSIFADEPEQAPEKNLGADAHANDLDQALNSIFAADSSADSSAAEIEDVEEDDGPIAGSGLASSGEDDDEDDDDEAVPEKNEDVHVRPIAAAAGHALSASLEYELSEDEYDQELVSIFLKKLKTDIRFIRDQASEIESGKDRREILERCCDAIGRLASSANYMEYLSLTAYCEDWQQAMKDDLVKLAGGMDADAAGHLRLFINEIIRVYPQIAEGELPPAKPESAKPESAEPVVTLPSPAPLPLLASSAGKEEASSDSVVEDERADDLELFARLSSALEMSMSNEGGAAEYPLDTVIEKMVLPEPSTSMTAAEPPVPDPEEPETEAAKEVESKVELPPAPVLAKSAPMAEAKQPAPEPKEELETEAAEEVDAAAEADAVESVPAPKQQFEEEASEEGVPVKAPVAKSTVRSSIRVDSEKIDYLMNQVGELVVSRAYFAQLVNEMRGLQLLLQERSKLTKSELKPLHEFAFRLSEAGIHLGRVSNELQEGVMKIRMLPIEQLFKRYPRLVRDLIHRTDKDVRLVTKGEETELDKMVIEAISDPLIHIIRNAVDHGIESVEDRRRLGKPGHGTLFLEAFHESDHIVLEISDDGRGIDPRRIKAKALEKDLFSKEELERMTEAEVIRIIMEPGFSTAERTTETSGRGVGMDVVRKNIERLNGLVEIVSTVGKGTRLRIKIPLTMAIIQALMVRVGKEKFTIPLTTVEETLRIYRHDISAIEGVDVIHIRGITMPIFRLSKIYNLDRMREDEEKMFVVVVSTGTQEVGLVVDELLGQEEVVIKPLADYLRAESGFGGATILGDGGISLILDIPELVKIASENQADRQEQRVMSFKRKRRRRNAVSPEEQLPLVH